MSPEAIKHNVHAEDVWFNSSPQTFHIGLVVSMTYISPAVRVFILPRKLWPLRLHIVAIIFAFSPESPGNFTSFRPAGAIQVNLCRKK